MDYGMEMDLPLDEILDTVFHWTGAQRNFALTFPTDLPSQIFSLRNAVIAVIKVRFMLSI